MDDEGESRLKRPSYRRHTDGADWRKRQRAGSFIATFILLAALLALPGLAFGDAGGFSGGSDYGGGSGSWSGGGSSWGDSDSSYDSGNNYYYYGDSSSSDSGGGTIVDIGSAIVIVLVICIVFYMFTKMKGKGSGGAQPAGAQITPDSRLKSIPELQAEDPEFNQEKIEQKIGNLYVQMQNAWTAKDFEPMRPYFTNDLFSQFDRQLSVFRQQKKTNYVDDIAVLDVAVRGWYEQDDNDCLVARVRTRIKDYTLDDKSGEVLAGDRNKELFMEYEYTLVRTKGKKTTTQGTTIDTQHCPNCGAPINLAQSAKCEYCGSIITAKDYDWVISIIKGVSQESGS